MTIRPISKCQTNFNEIAEICRTKHEPVFITRNGYEDLVLMSVRDYERALARLDVYDKLAAAQREIDEGVPLIPMEDAFTEIRAHMKARDHG